MSFQRTMTMAIKQATRQRDVFAQEVSRMEERRAAAQQQWEQLKKYAQDTQGNYLRHVQRTLHPSLMQHHHQFMGRLDQAIDLQEGVLDQTMTQLAQHRLKLMACEQRLTMLVKWFEKKQGSARMQHARLDQKMGDELAQQMFVRTSGTGNGERRL
jgi:flagellar FliJ protein